MRARARIVHLPIELSIAMEPERSKRALLEAAATALSISPNKSLGRTLLNKILFYADLVAFLQVGRLITAGKYIALARGPVVSNYPRKLLRPLERSGIAVVANIAEDDLTLPITLVNPPEAEALSVTEQRIVEMVAREAIKHRASDWSEFSHRNLGWKLAWATGAANGGPGRLINMRIAIQQLADPDPWLKEPADVDLETAFVEAEGGATLPWD